MTRQRETILIAGEPGRVEATIRSTLGFDYRVRSKRDVSDVFWVLGIQNIVAVVCKLPKLRDSIALARAIHVNHPQTSCIVVAEHPVSHELKDAIAGGEVLRVLPVHAPEKELAEALKAASSRHRSVSAGLDARSAARQDHLDLLGQFRMQLTHDLKNAVACILMNVELLKRDLEESGATPTAQETLDTLEEAVWATNRLVQSHQKPGLLLSKNTDVFDTIEQCGRLIRGYALQKGVSVQYSTPKNLPHTKVGAAELLQALLNVSMNALHWCPKNTGAIRVTARWDNNEVRVSIDDNGPGFSATALSNAGKPFFSERSDGTGLGLHATNRILEREGGALRLGNSAEGATVALHLPISR